MYSQLLSKNSYLPSMIPPTTAPHGQLSSPSIGCITEAQATEYHLLWNRVTTNTRTYRLSTLIIPLWAGRIWKCITMQRITDKGTIWDLRHPQVVWLWDRMVEASQDRKCHCLRFQLYNVQLSNERVSMRVCERQSAEWMPVNTSMQRVHWRVLSGVYIGWRIAVTEEWALSFPGRFTVAQAFEVSRFKPFFQGCFIGLLLACNIFFFSLF